MNRGSSATRDLLGVGVEYATLENEVDHPAREISRILGPELAQDVGAMDLDRSLTDAQIHGRFLAGGAGCDQRQNFTLARRQQLASGEYGRQAFRAEAVVPLPRACLDRAAHARLQRVG